MFLDHHRGLVVRIIIVLIAAAFCGVANAESFSYLCGDPPPVDNPSLKGELDGGANFLSKFIGEAKLKGNIEVKREEIFSKYPNADKLVVDHYMLYQTCVLLMNDESLSTSQKLEELRDMRREFESVSVSQKVAGTCRHKDFGLEKWDSQEDISQSSGWVGGGSNPTNWCNQLIGQIMSRRKIGPVHKATVIKKSEDGRWTGWHGRDRQYNYHCTVRIQWNPIYMEKQDASRCGTI